MSVLEEKQDDVYRITFNRPEKKNAFDLDLLSALYQGICNAEANKSSIVVIRGSGKAFSAGGDIADMRNMHDSGRMSEGMELLKKGILMIRNINAIVIAVLEGPVVGASVGLSLACDLSVAAENAVINLAFRRIGLAPDGGCSLLLPRIIGAKRFNELFLFSRNVKMDEAKALGLVNFVWQEDVFEEKLQQLISDLKKLPMDSIGYFKSLANEAVFSGLEDQLLQEQKANCDLFTEPSFKKRLEKMFQNK